MTIDQLNTRLDYLEEEYSVHIQLTRSNNIWYITLQTMPKHVVHKPVYMVTKDYSNLEDAVDVIEIALKEHHE